MLCRGGGGGGNQGCFLACVGTLAPLSSRTYPVLARVALTPTHTATKTAGKPVGTEGALCEGLWVGPSALMTPSLLPCCPDPSP